MNVRASLAGFIAVSLAVHAAFVLSMAIPDNGPSAAGPPPALTSQGNSFADMVQGSAQASPATPTTPVTPQALPTPTASLTPAAPTQMSAVEPAVAPAAPPQVFEALPDVQVNEVTAETQRPPSRPATLGQTPPPPPPRQTQQAQQAPAAPRGNANQDAQRGTQTQAPSTGQAAPSGQGQQVDQAAVAAARQAAASYGNVVMRQISRTRRERTRSRGVAVVSFRVAASGQLSSVGIAQSSGDADLDRIAVNHVRRAAPFPAPPRGAQTSFSIQFQGR